MSDSKSKTTDDPAESYMSAWPKSAEDVSGHYHPGPESKPLSEKEWTGIMRRAIDSAIDNVVSQDRIVLVAEVRRLRAENARLQSGLAETRGHLADKEHREEDLVRENARQAETIARLRAALEYASGWFAALPGEAENKLREALKEGT